MTKLLYDAIRGSSGTADSIQLHASDQSVTFKGDVVFDNSSHAGNDMTWDGSDKQLEFTDNTRISVGNGNDLLIFHNGTDTNLESATGALKLWSNDLQLKSYNDGDNYITCTHEGSVTLHWHNGEKARTVSDGFTVGKSSTAFGTAGVSLFTNGEGWFTRDGSIPISVNRLSNDGELIRFHQAGTNEGNISISGSTVSYNGGHLSRWSQFKGLSKTDKSARPTIYQGTVLSNLDDLCEWDKEINQQLNMTKVSDTVGDKNVAGVFWTWDDADDEVVNDFYVAMTGDMIIRVAGSTSVARGDLLISAGDGTAKPQADDIIRSSTIAKIISTNSTATYADGSKAYPCVLMAC